MQEFKLDGRMTVASMKDLFKTLTGGTLRVKDGGRKADESATVASIRKESDNKSGAFALNPEMTVGDFKAKMLSDYGLKVEVGTPDDWVSVPDGITLGQLRELPKNAVKAQLEALVTNTPNSDDDSEVDDFVEEEEEEDTYEGNYEEEEEEDYENEEETIKYGLIDTAGEFILEPKFDSIDDFVDGLAKVSYKDKYGFIDKEGNIVIEPKFDDAQDFSEGLAAVKIGDKYGFIDKTGKMVIKPQYTYVRNFNAGCALVFTGAITSENENDRHYIDTKGNVITDLRPYTNNDNLESFWDFSTKKHGYTNSVGDTVIEAQFDDANDFSEGLGAVEIDGKYGFIDKTGKIVIAAKYETVCDFSEGFAYVDDGEEEIGFIDKTGKLVIDLKKENLRIESTSFGCFHDGLVYVSNEQTHGLIDKTGKFVIELNPSLGPVVCFNEGLGVFYYENGDEEYGYIDKTGEIVIDAQFAEAGAFHDGVAIVGMMS